VIPHAFRADCTCESANPPPGPPGPPEIPPLGKPDGGEPVGAPEGAPERKPDGPPEGKSDGRPVGKLDDNPAALRHCWIFFCCPALSWKPAPGPPDVNGEGWPDDVDEDDEPPQPVRATALTTPTTVSEATWWVRRGMASSRTGPGGVRRVSGR
jgi:hypothetical protein